MNASTLLEELENHPLTAEIRGRQKAETLERRREAAIALTLLEKREQIEIPALKEKIDSAETRLKLWQGHKAALEIELAGARHELSVSALHNGLDRQAQEALLFETADPEIDAAIQHFREVLTELRGAVRVIGRPSRLNVFTMTRETASETNVDAVFQAMNYCRAAITELEKMKLHPDCDYEKILTLKNEIPSVDVFTENRGERNYARFPNFALDAKIALEGAANYLEVVTSKLLEKADRMTRLKTR